MATGVGDRNQMRHHAERPLRKSGDARRFSTFYNRPVKASSVCFNTKTKREQRGIHVKICRDEINRVIFRTPA